MLQTVIAHNHIDLGVRSKKKFSCGHTIAPHGCRAPGLLGNQKRFVAHDAGV